MAYPDEQQTRLDIVEVGRRLWLQGYVASNDGNISVRLGPDRLLTTPKSVSKGFMTPEMMVVTDMDGVKVHGERDASSELKMHLEVYQQRPDIGAVVHAHPPVTIAFSLAGQKLPQCVLPEIVMIFGSIPTASYATPCTDEGPRAIAELIGDCDALIIERHGTITVGDTVFTAYDRLEKVEHSAQVSAAARQCAAQWAGAGVEVFVTRQDQNDLNDMIREAA